MKLNLSLTTLATCCALSLATGPRAAEAEAVNAAKPDGAAAAAATPATQASEPIAAAEPASRITRYAVAYTVRPDGAYTEDRSWSMAVVKADAAGIASRTSVSYDPKVQKVSITEAHTLKPDGRRVKVPPANFGDTRDKSTGQADLSVQFVDVAAGDTVVLAYRVDTRTPMFARQFSLSETFPRVDIYDDVTLRIDVPASMWTQDEARGFREVSRSAKGGRKVVEWAWSNKVAQKAPPATLSGYENQDDAGVLFSTFRTGADLAKAYAGPAQARAVVTPKVRQQADQVVADAHAREPHDVARALHDWVTLNIANRGTCLSASSVVPDTAEAVLQRRAGDCKDHATLLQALLQAKGIASAPALLNAGNAYGQPRVPVASLVNHVINHVPSLGLYLDTTADTTPFGMLPFGDQDKPVFLADAGQAGARTPKTPVGANRQTMKTEVTVAPDGSASGQVEVELQGLFAVNARSRLKSLTQAQSAGLVKGFFESSGLVGTGTLLKDDARALRDTYHYRTQFKVDQWVKLPGPGSFLIAPLFYSESPIADYVGMASQPSNGAEMPCASGHSEEEYRYHLPANLTLERVPEDVHFENDKLSYHASYRLQDRVLTVQRVFDDRTPGNVCTPASIQAYKAFAAQAVPDSTVQVGFK